MRKATFGWALAGALGLVLTGAGVSVAQQNSGKPGAPTTGAAGKPGAKPGTPASGPSSGRPKETAKPKAPQIEIKSFELSRGKAASIQQAVTQSWGQYTQLFGKNNGGVAQPPKLAVDERTNILFVRGTKEEIEIVGQLIDLLDGDSGKESGDTKDLLVVHLKHAKPTQVMQVLSQLGLQGKVMTLPGTNSLLLARNGRDVDEIRSIIEKLDTNKTKSTKETKPTSPVTRTPGGRR